jgi:hypothetical protein
LNYTADIAASYRADARGTTLYADLLLDDVQSPFGWGKGDEVPRKIGQQYGVYFPNLGGAGRYGLRLEYTNTDPTTYTNVSEPIAWTNNGLPLATPIGPNTKGFFARLDAGVSERVHLSAEGELRRRSSDERGPVTPNVDRVSLFGTYTLRRDTFIGVRYDYRKTKTPNAPPDTRNRFEVNAGFGF